MLTNWIKEKIEVDELYSYSKNEKIGIYTKVAQAQLLEEFFHKKFSTHKRFGMDGSESVVVAVESVPQPTAVDHEVDGRQPTVAHRRVTGARGVGERSQLPPRSVTHPERTGVTLLPWHSLHWAARPSTPSATFLLLATPVLRSPSPRVTSAS